jgi:squalene-hopene/tetraprenyl-beta-curcumene cyclase
MSASPELDQAIAALTVRLLAKRTAVTHWEGYLSSSALSAATAVTALALAERATGGHTRQLIDGGIGWLTQSQQADGGWGDTVHSRSNLSTTLLCWGALSLSRESHPAAAGAIERVAPFLRREVGEASPERIRDAIINRYGTDRTFSVPILTVLAITGCLGEGRDAWRLVPQLPFELAALPHQTFQFLRLPVVSYALPALIAIGDVRHHHAPSRNPLTRALRSRLHDLTLRKLRAMQPSSGGYLEATPLTSFVVMSLIAAGHATHPVAAAGLEFLRRSARPDGSWPIDSNLATWVTTLTVNAFGAELPRELDRAGIRGWLLQQQFREEHPFTHAAPGGWAWTDLPGGVPDADDTAGALLALRRLESPRPPRADAIEAASRGVGWLLDLQNRDGGIPTFCRGWGTLPFDRSAPDLTAHALQAWAAWTDAMPTPLQARLARATRRALDYLVSTQREDGSWVPLWFGNEQAVGEENPVYGTAHVLAALAQIDSPSQPISAARGRAMTWLLDRQQDEGGWGGDARAPASVEETGIALKALARCRPVEPRVRDARARAVRFLIAASTDRAAAPTPIGLYFARLWYFEELYPLIYPLMGLIAAREALREGNVPR